MTTTLIAAALLFATPVPGTPAPTVSVPATSAPAAAAPVTEAQAVEIAKARVPGATVGDVEREDEHGERTWEVELTKGGQEHEIHVSEQTGKIVKQDTDQADARDEAEAGDDARDEADD
ncbi:PepSY domain-containing protein [Nonomuraea dietziae]|uniref:PepSY domain-containing protein n=1 Tax=Nonomuraea dietziae TaxID=65515 RepID=UPI0033ED0FE9